MYRFKRLLLTAAGITLAQTLTAQHHYNAWFRGTLSIPLEDKIKIDAEFQHRRQNGWQNRNMTDKNLMFTFRNWIHYEHNKNVKLSVSPFACFSNYRIARDKPATPDNEIRISIAGEYQKEIFRNIYLINRHAVEYRVFRNPQPHITRFRARLGARYEFIRRLKLTVSDEFFINVAGADHFPDQNRTGLNIEYKLLPRLKLEAGYIYLTRLPVSPASGSTKMYDNNIFLNLNYQR